MADDFIQMNPDGSGKKIRTQNRTVGANTVHEQYTITTDETTGNTARVLNTAPAATDYGLVVRPAPPLRTQRTLYIQSQTPSATGPALYTTSSVLNFATATTGTTFTVTSGKTFRVMAMTVTQYNSTTTAGWARMLLVVNTGGTATATSPIAAQLTATSAAAVANVGECAVVAFPEGIDIPSAASFAVPVTVSATTARFDIALFGYEYS